jgi:hypothetical protein
METLPSLAECDFEPELLSPVLKLRLSEIPMDLRRESEKWLRKKLKPSIDQVQFKEQFHKELKIAKERNRKMVIKRIYNGTYKKDFFYENVLYNHLLMAWVTTPLVELEMKISAALSMGADRFEELVSMDITTTRRIKNEDDEWVMIEEIDPKKAMVLVTVMKHLADRHMGLSVQKQVTLNVTEPSLRDGDRSELNMEKVNHRLKELEEKLGEASVEVLPPAED